MSKDIFFIFRTQGELRIQNINTKKNTKKKIPNRKKNIKINQGLVPKVLSKINPIIVPTATAATSSVLNLKAVPIDDGLSFLL